MKKNAMKLIRKCALCGKLQLKNEKESNGNWDVYDNNVECECGGAFKSYFEVEP